MRPRWWWSLFVVVLVFVVARAAWRHLAERQAHPSPATVRQAVERLLKQEAAAELPVYGEVPDFLLMDHHGQPITQDELLGSVWIADFIFTRCAGQCLMMTSQMMELQRRLPLSIQFVSLSVDPAWDTPQVLADYATRAGAHDARWRLVTGSQEAIFRLSREGFHLGVEEEGGTLAEPIIHSVRFVLVDQAGRIRGYYDGTDPEAISRLQRDAERLLQPAA